MACEPTDLEKERRIDARTKELLEDFEEFQNWLKTEFSLTNQAVIVHAYLVPPIKDVNAQAGNVMAEMWYEWCRGKAEEEG